MTTSRTAEQAPQLLDLHQDESSDGVASFRVAVCHRSPSLNGIIQKKRRSVAFSEFLLTGNTEKVTL
jgi:hypothetical protein